MKAAISTAFGVEGLQIGDVEKPVPKANEVLIKIRAASLNPLDWHMMSGVPLVGRGLVGLRKPNTKTPGVDVAGVIEAVGSGVTHHKAGDEVFGSCHYAVAEYACAPADKVVKKPVSISFEIAASVNVAGLTALQGLRDQAQVRSGQKVLIHGAAGGVGTFAIQIAKWLGADVTGVCRTSNVDLVRSLGADHIVDYTREDFTKGSQKYDVVYDCVGNYPLSGCKRVMAHKGKYIAVGVRTGKWIKPVPALLTLVFSRLMNKNVVLFVARVKQEDLTILGDLIVAGTLKPVIDKVYPLSAARDAVRHLVEGHPRGKIIVTP